MIVRSLFSALIVALLLTSPASAQLEDWWRSCTGKSDVDWDLQIKSCTSIIEAQQETPLRKAIAYKNRGNAWFEKERYDQAMAD